MALGRIPMHMDDDSEVEAPWACVGENSLGSRLHQAALAHGAGQA